MNDINVPLKKKLPPKTFSELGIIGVNLFVSIAYSDTQFEKTGIQALLGKLPVLKNLTPFKSPMCSMDIDLSCVALDRQGKALDVIWYGNLRNDTQSIRHSGDGLCGASNFEESLTCQEEIAIRLTQLDDDIHHLVFFVSSYHNNALAFAQKGLVKMADNEGNIAHKFYLDSLDKTTSAIIAWHIQRQGDDFVLAMPLKKIMLNSASNDTLVSDLTRLASQYLTG